MEWGQPTNGSAARRHSSQSHGFAVRLWSNLCICSPGVVKLVRTNLAPDFPLFHESDVDPTVSRHEIGRLGGGQRNYVKTPEHIETFAFEILSVVSSLEL